MSIPKLALTIDEAAEAAGVTPRTIRSWIAEGDLKAHRQTPERDARKKLTGNGVGKFLIRVADLEECLQNLPAA